MRLIINNYADPESDRQPVGRVSVSRRVPPGQRSRHPAGETGSKAAKATSMDLFGTRRLNQAAFSRRRALLIAAAAIGAPFLPWPASVASGTALRGAGRFRRWRGRVLGADATILLHGMDEAPARRLIRLCRDEITRLEDIFSLYRPDSALVRLNRDGELRTPPPELVELLSRSLHFGEITGGAFDVTVQALWNLYVEHFSGPNPDPAGPNEARRASALKLVDYTAIQVGRRRIAVSRPGMAITLNGIAQGYITDRIADLLRENGAGNVLVDLGETRAHGRHPSGRPWRIGLVDPARPERLAGTVALTDQAVASSGGYGTRFDPSGRNHHLFDRISGASASYNLGVSVIAPTATTADGLSTALSVMPLDRAAGCLDRFRGARAIVTLLDRSVVTLERP